jgi:hypothetical protein
MKELKPIIDRLLEEMNAKLLPVDLFNDELPSIGQIVSYLRSILNELHDKVSEFEFAHKAEEIEFFKTIKPVFMSQYLFHKKIFAIRLLSSFQLPAMQKERIMKALEDEQSFIRKNYEFYVYCMSNSTHLDAQYFTRNRDKLDPTNDPRFSTTHDRKLSRFIAGELLKEVLVNQLKELEKESMGAVPTLLWTASKTDLTELIYALQVTGVFNDGSADLKQVATAFEALFHINLGDYYRTFQAIQVRKNNQVSFITKLKERLQSKLDEKI